MSQITRKTKVVSVSLDPKTLKDLDRLCELTSQNRSSAISSLIRQQSLMEEFDRLREYGRKKAMEQGIKSEDDIYRIMGDA